MTEYKHRHKTILMATGFLFSLSLFSGAENKMPVPHYPLLTRSAPWIPYQWDGYTLALFHLDEKDETSKELELTDDNEVPCMDIKIESVTAPGIVLNANKMGPPGLLQGDAAPVSEGRLGGGLRFGDKGGALMFDTGAKSLSSHSTELWLKLDEMPLSAATIIYWDNPQIKTPDSFPLSPIILRVLADGALEVDIRRNKYLVGTHKLSVCQWTHLCLQWTVDRYPYENNVILFAQGKEIWRQRQPIGKPDLGPECRLNMVTVGNDPSMKSGIKGIIDEVRISKTIREFYEYDLDWVELNKQAPVRIGQPYFRDESDLIFRAGFNRTLTPDLCVPGTAFKEHTVTKADCDLNPAKVRELFPDGVEGTALMLGEGSLSPVYRGIGNVLPQEGTIAFWLRPLDWDNLSRDNPYDNISPLTFGLLQIDGVYPDDSYYSRFSRKGWLLEFNINKDLNETLHNPAQLTPGIWTHITITWDEKSLFSTYVNGEKHDLNFDATHGEWRIVAAMYPNNNTTGEKPVPEWWLKSLPDALRFGTMMYWDKLNLPAPRSAIDDFRVYRRALSRSELRNLVRICDHRKPLLPLPDMDMDVDCNGATGLVKVKITALMKDYASAAYVSAALFKEGDTKPVGRGTASMNDRKLAMVEFRTPVLEFAKYVLKAEVKNTDGKVIGNAEQAIVRKQPPWWKCRAGLSDKVPPPWTPIQAGDRTVRVWGREIVFSSVGLPENIVSAGEDILGGPIKILLDGKPLPMENGKFEIVSAKEARVDVRGTVSAAEVSFETEASIEFDGMIWFRLAMKAAEAGKTARIGRLAMHIPFRSENAGMFHWWSGQRDFRNPKVVHIGTVPEGTGIVFRSNDDKIVERPPELRGSFIPYMSLVGDKRGMAWFAENDQGWTQSIENAAVSVERGDGVVTLVLNIISEPVNFDLRAFEFGLHPVPVRPLTKYWRRGGGVMPDTFTGNNLKGDRSTVFHAYPEDDWDAVRRRIDGEGLTKKAAGLKILFSRLKAEWRKELGREPAQDEYEKVPGLYWDLNWVGFPKEMREWAEAWYPGYPNVDDYLYYTPEFLDYISWAWNEWIEHTDKFIQGFYMDDCWNRPHTKAGGPHTYALADGHVQPGFEFRGFRERIKRAYQICVGHGIYPPRLTAHTTHTYFIPYHSFFTSILDGEDKYSHPCSQDDFIDHWPPDRIRFMNSEKWGIPSIWLGYSGPIEKKKYESWIFRQERAYAANLAVHDIARPFPESVLKETRINMPDTEFVPYWNLHGLASHTHKNLLVSAWKCPGKCVVILVNIGAERFNASVKLDPMAMGFGDVSPAKITARQADQDILTYFRDDVTTTAKPKLSESNGTYDNIESAVADMKPDENPDDLPVEQRRANDPDGKFEWKDGVLSCPVRRHDYRLFEFGIE